MIKQKSILNDIYLYGKENYITYKLFRAQHSVMECCAFFEVT